MAKRWFDDEDKLRTFVFALQNKVQKIFDKYSIDMNNWDWIERDDGTRALIISGDVTGEETCAYNQRDVDDWDDMDIDFETEVEIGAYSEEHLSEITKQQFFEETVKDLTKDIRWCVENKIEYLYERMTEEDPDRYRD